MRSDAPAPVDAPASDQGTAPVDAPVADQGPAPSDGGGDAGGASLIATVRGPLRGTVEQTRQGHNMFVEPAMAQLNALGDVGHHLYIALAPPPAPDAGIVDAGATGGERFMAVDRWTNLAGAMGFYGSPEFVASAGATFSSPPEVVLWRPANGFDGYNVPPAAGMTRRYLFAIRGTLRDTVEVSRMSHNVALEAGRVRALELGDTQHFAYFRVDEGTNPRTLMIMDNWTDLNGALRFYSDPGLVEFFRNYFAAPPEVVTFSPAAGTWVIWGEEP